MTNKYVITLDDEKKLLQLYHENLSFEQIYA